MRYGLPYQGSKNKLAERIVDLLPPAAHLYDVFAGGCAVSHAAILSGKFGCVHFSDTNDAVTLFRDALEGNVPDGSEWISREEFFKRKDTDPYVRVVWSFGNNQRDYLYSREIEPYKRAVHEMIFAPTPNERRLKFREVCRLMPLIINGGRACHASMERSRRLCTVCNQGRGAHFHPPENLGKRASNGEQQRDLWHTEPYRLQAEERRGQLDYPFCLGEYEMKVADYRSIEILPDSVIYCDPPYFNTRGYMKGDFDHEAFYDWCERQTQPLYISEYWMPEDRFVSIAEFECKSMLSPTNKLSRIEKIYRPINQLAKED